jgi:transposase
MRTFVFTDEQIETLRHERLRHPTLAVRQKLDVLWLKSQGIAQQEISRMTGMSRRTVQRYLDTFLVDGLQGLTTTRCARPQSRLLDYCGILEDHFLEHPPATVAQAQADIERLTGLKRGPTQVRAFLKKRSICVGAKSARSRPRPTRTPSGRSWIGS